jgi:hypothetical protein
MEGSKMKSVIENRTPATVLFAVSLLVASLMIAGIVAAATIEVRVGQELVANVSSFTANSSADLVGFKIEYYNTGSIPYKARVRLDIINSSGNGNGGDSVFTAWGQEKPLMPGDKDLITIYYYTNSSGKLLIRVRLYYGMEYSDKYFIVEKKTASNSNPYNDTDSAYVSGIRTYDDYIVADIHSIRDVKGLVLIPKDFPSGWIFPQVRIGDLMKDSDATVIIPYSPSLFVQRGVVMQVASIDGFTASERDFVMAKEHGVVGLVRLFLDRIKGLIHHP